MFNEIDGSFDDVAIRTFKIGLLGVCVSSWTMLMSISGSRRTSNRERKMLKWSLRIEGILGRIGTITTNLEEISQGILDLLLLK